MSFLNVIEPQADHVDTNAFLLWPSLGRDIPDMSGAPSVATLLAEDAATYRTQLEAEIDGDVNELLDMLAFIDGVDTAELID